jgi:salicylate hydroxylase
VIMEGAGEERIVSEEMGKIGNRADKDFEETPEQYFEYNFGYDVIRDSVQNMQEAFPGWELPGNFFQIEPVRGTYP